MVSQAPGSFAVASRKTSFCMDVSAKPRQLESLQFNIREVFVNVKLDKEAFASATIDLSPTRPPKGEDKLLKSNTQLTWRPETDVGKLGKMLFSQGNLLKTDQLPGKNGALAG